MNYIGKRLKEERKKANLTSKEFANMVGVSPWYITQIESGKKNPSLKTFIKFVNILNISADVLIKDITSTGKWYKWRVKRLKFKRTKSDITDYRHHKKE